MSRRPNWPRCWRVGKCLLDRDDRRWRCCSNQYWASEMYPADGAGPVIYAAREPHRPTTSLIVDGLFRLARIVRIMHRWIDRDMFSRHQDRAAPGESPRLTPRVHTPGKRLVVATQTIRSRGPMGLPDRIPRSPSLHISYEGSTTRPVATDLSALLRDQSLYDGSSRSARRRHAGQSLPPFRKLPASLNWLWAYSQAALLGIV